MREHRIHVAALLAALLLAPACQKNTADTIPPDPAGETDQSDDAAGTAPDQAADTGPDQAAIEEALRAAVDSEERPADDRARDADRKPFEVLSFLGIGPGMHVADLASGFGYYTEILARAVGPEGRVYAQNNQYVLENFVKGALGERLARLDMDHVQRLDSELDDPGLPAGELDAAIMVLFYHDTYWMGTDRARMNKAVFDALKPGGVYGIIDHHAEAGSGDRDVKTIHRVDAELVKQELLAAGFVLEAESDVLHHPEDDRTLNVFAPELRGKSDRFVYRFRKPR